MGSARQRAVRGDGERLRAELVGAAIELLLQPQSAQTPSLRAIARSCGVAPSAVYMHFASQEALMYAVTDELFGQLRAALDLADTAEDSPEVRLTVMIEAYLDWSASHPGAYQLLFERPDPPPETGIGPGLDLLERLGAALSAITGRQEPSTALRAWSILHGIASLRIHKPAAPWQATPRQDAHAIIRALI
ncbi:TetR/AcrR family transcriptional regulator [Nocardia salmonicida]|uniref:TetR/AcrR family transcriptional regulator n=1 Tax=Nocardia salmonicida TaxID=53431 RepID=UPI003644EDF1